MNQESIILWRNILLRSFVVGVVATLLLLGATIAFWHAAVAWAGFLFHVEEKALARNVLQFFTNVRLIVVYLFLVPALALHWTQKSIAR